MDRFEQDVLELGKWPAMWINMENSADPLWSANALIALQVLIERSRRGAA
jgi:hypothetical protein